MNSETIINLPVLMQIRRSIIDNMTVPRPTFKMINPVPLRTVIMCVCIFINGIKLVNLRQNILFGNTIIVNTYYKPFYFVGLNA